jgi:D-alanyl-D-alanine carboxypeptidase
VAIWQSRRAYDHSLPPADRLMLVGCEEFFHPERPEELRQVERQAYQAYRKMIGTAAAELSLDITSAKYLKIISAFRSPEYQKQLRRQSPRAGRAGLAVNSPHFTGRALDLYVGGEPVSTRDGNRAQQTQTRVYRWLVKNAGRFGFHPYFYEPWHWEYQPQKQ